MNRSLNIGDRVHYADDEKDQGVVTGKTSMQGRRRSGGGSWSQGQNSGWASVTMYQVTWDDGREDSLRREQLVQVL